MLSLWGGSARITCVPGGREEDTRRLCSVVPSSSRSRGKGQKPMHRKFHLNTRKKTARMTADWNMVPTEVVGSPLLKKVRKYPDAIPCHVLWDDTA